MLSLDQVNRMKPSNKQLKSEFKADLRVKSKQKKAMAGQKRRPFKLASKKPMQIKTERSIKTQHRAYMN